MGVFWNMRDDIIEFDWASNISPGQAVWFSNGDRFSYKFDDYIIDRLEKIIFPGDSSKLYFETDMRLLVRLMDVYYNANGSCYILSKNQHQIDSIKELEPFVDDDNCICVYESGSANLQSNMLLVDNVLIVYQTWIAGDRFHDRFHILPYYFYYNAEDKWKRIPSNSKRAQDAYNMIWAIKLFYASNTMPTLEKLEDWCRHGT